MENTDQEKISLFKRLCEISIERLTDQMNKASYWKKFGYWKQRLWWKDRLSSLNEMENT